MQPESGLYKNINDSKTMKKTTVLSINLVMGILLIFLSSYTFGQQPTEITITGVRSVKGKVIVQVFKDNASYQDEKPYKKIVFEKKGIINGTLAISFNLEAGTYGFTLVDDENGNGKIDKNMIGMPKEGFGFSNFFMEKMKKPSFDDFKTNLKPQSKIVIKVKYM